MIDPFFVKYKNQYYDISEFKSRHPGGELIFANSRKKDITEVVQSYHSSKALVRVEGILSTLPRVSAKSLGEQPADNFQFGETYTKMRDKVYDSNPVSCDPYDLIIWVTLAMYIMTFTGYEVIDGIIKGLCMIILAGYGHQYVHTSSHKGALITLAGFNSYVWRDEHVLSHHPYTNTEDDIDLIDFRDIDQQLPVWPWLKYIITSAVIVFRPYLQYVIWMFKGMYKKFTMFDVLAIAWNIYDISYGFGTAWVIKKFMVSMWFLAIDYINHYALDDGVVLGRTSDEWAEQQIGASTNVSINTWLYDKHPFVHSLLCFGLDRQAEHHLLPQLKMEHLSLATYPGIRVHRMGWSTLVSFCNHFVWK